MPLEDSRFAVPPLYSADIVKQFTSDIAVTLAESPTLPAHTSRRTPAMRFALLTTVVVIGALACGKKGDQNQTQAAPPAPPASEGAAAPAGPVVEVKMTGNGSTRA